MSEEPVPDDAAYAELLDERFRQAEEQRNALVAAIDQMRAARSLTSADDEHDPEGSTVSLDQARDDALLVRTERTLAELTAARDRLTLGRYGVCEQCARPIPSARLLARPEARFCVPCATLRPPSPGPRPAPR
jgi:DnaK suppressor protein